MSLILIFLIRIWALIIILWVTLPLSGRSASRAPVTEAKSRPDTDRSGISKEPVNTEGGFLLVDEMPQLIGGLGSVQKHVVYPPSLIRAGIEGRVFVQFVVDEEGIPRDFVVVRSLHYLLEQPAIDALMEARFIPGKRDGVAVPVKMSLPVTFVVPRSCYK